MSEHDLFSLSNDRGSHLKTEPRFDIVQADINLNAEPQAPDRSSFSRKFVTFEPICDVRLDHTRLALHRHNGASVGGAGFLSFAVHAGVAGFAFLGGQLGFLFEKKESNEVVEVTFGLEIPTQSRAPAAPKKTEVPPAEAPEVEQATKSAETLPQLPKRFEVKTTQPEVKDDSLPAPKLPDKEDTRPAPQAEKTPEPQPKSTPAPEPTAQPEPSKVVAPERDKDAQKVDFDEVRDRLEKEQREVAAENKEGQKEKPKKVSSDLNIPDNPLADPANAPLPDMPDNLGPTGSLSGKKLAGSAAEAYKTAASVHMKRFWTLPDLYNFPRDLKAQAVVVVDLFGKIRSLEISESSGNRAFDSLILEQIKKAEPFPDLPAGAGRSQKLYMSFQPQSIE